jgi:hypothetical protein
MRGFVAGEAGREPASTPPAAAGRSPLRIAATNLHEPSTH